MKEVVDVLVIVISRLHDLGQVIADFMLYQAQMQSNRPIARRSS